MREFRPIDVAGIYRLTMQTAFENHEDQKDIDVLLPNQDLYGHVFAGPYIFYNPLQVQVVVDDYGLQACLMSTLDIHNLEQWAENLWWPPLQDQYPRESSHYLPLEKELVNSIHRPIKTSPYLAQNYPVRIDIRVGKRLDKADTIKKLLTYFMEQGWSRESPGIHTIIMATDKITKEVFLDAGFMEDRMIAVNYLRMVRSL